VNKIDPGASQAGGSECKKKKRKKAALSNYRFISIFALQDTAMSS
jgi:hypothetical protein